MKKLAKATALLAAGALFFGGAFLSCSSDGLPPELGGTGGAQPTPQPTSVSTTYTGPDSWNFVSQADTVDWVKTFKTNTVTKESDGTLALDKSGDITIRGASDKAALTLLAEKAWSGATAPNYSYATPASGLRIKNPAMKITGVTGNVKLKIEWECIKGKDAGDRKLIIYKGANTVLQEVENDTTKSATSNVAMTDFEKDIALDSATDLYIGASDNIFIKTVTLTSVDSVSATKVTGIEVTGTGVTDDAVSLQTGDTLELGVTVTPATADDKTVTWSSSDSAKVSVDKDGKITAVAATTTPVTITATAKDGSGKTGTVKVTVVAAKTYNAYESWTLTGTQSWNTGLTGAVKYVKNNNKYDITVGQTEITSDYTILKDNVEVTGASSSSTKLVVSNYAGTDVSTTGNKVGSSAAIPDASATGQDKAPTAISYKIDNEKGLMIKNDALKVGSLAAGDYELTVKAYQNSKTDRNLEVTIGASGTTETKAAGTTQGDFEYTKKFTASAATDIYIGASNEIYIKEIILKKAE